MKNTNKIYDLVIIGTGFAGYSAAIYASRYKISNIIIGEVFGGQTAEAHKICNYPGFEEISGVELMTRVRNQATKLGTEEQFDRVVDINTQGDILKVITKSGEGYLTKFALLTVGVKRKMLNVPGEDQFKGKGLTYCATCDGFFFKDKIVAVVGGGDAATTSALYLAALASKVYLIIRGPQLKGETAWIDQALSNPKITVYTNTAVTEVAGTQNVEKIKTAGAVEELTVDGVFVEIGSEPDKSFLSQLNLATDQKGYVLVDKTQKTSRDHIYAAGDITSNSNNFEQLVTAGGEAAVAVNALFERLQAGNISTP